MINHFAVLPVLVPDDSQLRPGLDPSQVTPGLLGFIMTLAMVIAMILLMRSMAKRIRRVRYREELAATDVAPIDGPESPLPFTEEKDTKGHAAESAKRAAES